MNRTKSLILEKERNSSCEVQLNDEGLEVMEKLNHLRLMTKMKDERCKEAEP